LTIDQQIFIALCKQEEYRTLLSPYISDKPSEEQLMKEQQKMHELAMKYKNKEYAGKDLFLWDGKSPIYED
jgi:hypothetical protein